MNWTYYISLVIFLVVAAQVYFTIAVKFRILDKPNQRSSHTLPTIRGGGILFPLSILFFFCWKLQLCYFIAGVVMLAGISFWDDIRSSSAIVRVVMHMLAIGLLFYEVTFFDWPEWIVILAFVVCVGSLSAFNFMDGINGITGMYALTTVGTFLYLSGEISFMDEYLLVTVILSVLVFLFYNFRIKARCFAGDIGSVSLAFIQIFMLMRLIDLTQNLWWVLLFFVFGIDAVVTILIRIAKRQNIFKPHRSHLYQYLANEMKVNQLIVSSGYALVQLLLNIFLVYFIQTSQPIWILIPVALITVGYTWARVYVSHAVKS
ncbi:MAG: UDP-GlcNAc--UDP-phosphate GlcNAc-1-phosphate transferase [Cyclobacteriaceae bacterium]|nr:UDP-GlcNAc--UDP-phosphate GlcNAc-1-phosphate transferase [Cyclobacteriaceae bacterium]